MSELDEISHLQDLLDKANRYSSYLKEQIKTLETANETYRSLARKRLEQITSLEEEVEETRELLTDLEAKVAGRACFGSQNCGFDQE